MARDSSDEGSPLPPPPGALPPPPPGLPTPSGLPPQSAPAVKAEGDNTEVEQKEQQELLVPPAAEPTPAAPSGSESDTIDLNALSGGAERHGGVNRDQMYGHIDRIASGEVGTLLDRFANRFGSELDREIIVLRRKEQQAARAAQPIVQLISLPDEPDAEEPEEEQFETEEIEEEWEEEEDSDDIPELPPEMVKRLQGEMAKVTKQIKPLQQKYKLAKQRRQSSKVAKMAPKLRLLIDRRNLLLEVIEGRRYPSALVEKKKEKGRPSRSTKPSPIVEEDAFPDFVDVVNDLLGDMPDEFVQAFIQTDGFKLLQAVAENPGAVDDGTRNEFFQMANKELGELPEEKLDEFVKSADFEIFQLMGELYG